jgi:hypothetical protein
MHALIRRKALPQRALSIVFALVVVGGLTGCSSFREAIGAGKSPPDEFAVVTKAPLVVPPDFALRPPEPGAPRPQEMTPAAAAHQTVFGLPPAPPTPAPGTSQGEVILLAMAGADRADADIRKIIESETLALEAKDKGFADRILFWKGETDSVVDAEAEAQRLRETEASGATGGIPSPHDMEAAETPKAETRQQGGIRGWLQKISPF